MKAILILLAILAFEQGYCSHDSFTGLNLDKYPCKPEYLRVSIVAEYLKCSWHQKNEYTNSPIHEFKVLQNVFKMKKQG